MKRRFSEIFASSTPAHTEDWTDAELDGLNRGQREAVRMAWKATTKHVFIGGGPGTGKTEKVIKTLCRRFLSAGFGLVIAATVVRVTLSFVKEFGNNPAVLIASAQSIMQENNPDPAIVKPREKALRRIRMNDPRASVKCRNRRVIGIVLEFGNWTGGQLTLFKNTLKCFKSSLVRLIGDGDPMQVEAIGSPAATSEVFHPENHIKIALCESMRFQSCPKLNHIVNNLRQIDEPIDARTLRLLAAHTQKTRNATRSDITLVPTQAMAAAGRKEAASRYPIWTRITSTGKNVSKHQDTRYVVKGERHVVCRNLLLKAAADGDIVADVDTDQDGDTAGAERVANGEFVTVIDWQHSDLCTAHGGMREIVAGDKAIPFFVIEVERTKRRLKLPWTTFKGKTTLELNLASHVTIHWAQGATLEKFDIDTGTGLSCYNPRVLLLVALSRGLKLDCVGRFLCGNPSIVCHGGPTHPAHKELVRLYLKLEKELRERHAAEA